MSLGLVPAEGLDDFLSWALSLLSDANILNRRWRVSRPEHNLMSKKSSTLGISLLELVISLGVLSVVALGLLSMFISARAASQGGTSRAQSANIAELELSKLRVLPYADLEGYLTTPRPDSVLTIEGVTYTSNLQVERLDTNPSKREFRLLWLHLKLKWAQKDVLDSDQATKIGSKSVERTFEMSTLVSPNTAQ